MNARGLFIAVLAALGLAAATASADPTLRVHGSVHFEASAALDTGRLVLSGLLSDDTGRALPGRVVGARLLSADGRELGTPVPEACPGEPDLGRDAGEPGKGELELRSDSAGRFCVVVPARDTASVALSFVDPAGLFEPSTRRLVVEASRPGVSLKFVEPPLELELGLETQRLAVAARTTGLVLDHSAPLPLALYARAVSAKEGQGTLIAQGACELGQTTTLTFSSADLPGPGPVDLSLRFSGSERLQPAEARVRLHATARVTLALSRAPTPGDPREGIEIDVALAAADAAVGTGAVEAMLGGRTVGIARVERGSAGVTVRFPRGGAHTTVELRYLPSEPWWRPGPTLKVEVPLSPRSPWGSLGWLALLVAVTVYVVRSWRRPRPEPRQAPVVAPSAPAASVVVVERDETSRGWRGSVQDAHDASPLAGAELVLLEQGSERRVVARATADAAGQFELTQPLLERGELRLSVSAPWHSELIAPAPEFGRIRIDLVTRRRQLLTRLARWAGRRPPFGRARGEPTPADVERVARKTRREGVADWARALESAAYGPDPVDERVEREVLRREPPDPAGAPGRPR